MNNSWWLLGGIVIGAMYFQKNGEGIDLPGVGSDIPEGGNYDNTGRDRLKGGGIAFEGARPTGNTGGFLMGGDSNVGSTFDGVFWFQGNPNEESTSEREFHPRGGSIDISPPRTAKPWRPEATGGGWA